MSGTCQEWNYDAPGGRPDSEAAVASGMQQKYAQNATYNGADALARLRGPHGG